MSALRTQYLFFSYKTRELRELSKASDNNDQICKDVVDLLDSHIRDKQYTIVQSHCR